MKTKRLFLVVLLVTVLSGCASLDSYDYNFVPDTNDGPGLISGEKGEFVIVK